MLIVLVSHSQAQERFFENRNANFYVRAGLTMQIGSHQNRMGAQISGTFGESFANIGFQYHVLYTFSDLGYFEQSVQHIGGLQLSSSFVKNDAKYRSITDSPFGNDRFYEFYYLYRYYFNNWNTQQPTGELGLNFGYFFLKHENDLLAAKSVDKFRTAAMRLGYRDSVQSIATSFIFWTGNKDHHKTKRINSSNFSRYGYYDLSETPFGRYSHGILSLDYMRQMPFGNQVMISAGYDHERIRNAIQNQFMHDLPIWPKKWNTAKSRYVPMVDQNGNAFLFKNHQKLRKAKVYWGVSLNSLEFY